MTNDIEDGFGVYPSVLQQHECSELLKALARCLKAEREYVTF